MTSAVNQRTEQETRSGTLQTQSLQLSNLELSPLSLSHPTQLAPIKQSTAASPNRRLPPVAPPIKQSAAALGRTFQKRSSSSGRSAMDLDLALSPSTPSAQHEAFTGKEASSETFMDFQQLFKASSSMTTVRTEKTAKKQAPALLPPISGSTGKFSAHKRSSSMDSFVWGVAPVVNSRVEWGSTTQLAF